MGRLSTLYSSLGSPSLQLALDYSSKRRDNSPNFYAHVLLSPRDFILHLGRASSGSCLMGLSMPCGSRAWIPLWTTTRREHNCNPIGWIGSSHKSRSRPLPNLTTDSILVLVTRALQVQHPNLILVRLSRKAFWFFQDFFLSRLDWQTGWVDCKNVRVPDLSLTTAAKNTGMAGKKYRIVAKHKTSWWWRKK